MDTLFAGMAGVMVLFGVTIDLNTATVAGFIIACIAAYPGWRLVGVNRRKVIAEAGAVTDTKIRDAAQLFATDNAELRKEMRQMRTEHAAEVAQLEGKVDALEHRCDQLTKMLVDNGVPVPPPVAP